MKLCECGCGQPTPLAKQSERRRGYVKGQPMRFVAGHGSRPLAPEYAIEDRGYETPCWVWQRYTKTADGYGVRGRAGRLVLAHRDAWERLHGEIPEGMEIDHKCRVRSCVNPDHLWLATRHQNQQNLSPAGKRGISGRRNVAWDRTGWVARVMVNGKSHYLGIYADPDDAASVAAAFRREHMPFSEADRVALDRARYAA